jgi:hypothetical protein
MGAALLSVVPAGTASAVDPTCVFTTGDVRTYVGPNGGSWANPANWSPPGIPNDNTSGNAVPETSTTYVCIGSDTSVYMDADELFDAPSSSGWVQLQGYWLGARSTLQVRPGVALFNNDATKPSVTEETSTIDATSAYVGGQGTLLVKGDLSVAASSATGASSLTSAHGTQPTVASEGHLDIDTTGRLLLPALGVQMVRGYDVVVHGRLQMTGTGFLAPDYDTSVTVEPAGVYEFGGVGGFYEGPAESPVDPTTLINRGTLLKTGVGTTSLIGTTNYTQQGSGTVVVTGGTLAFAGGTVYSAEVSGGQQLSTAECAPHGSNEPCVAETNPGVDRSSVTFRVPSSDDHAAVQLTENADLDFTAHAPDLTTGSTDPALITFRLGAAVVGTTRPADVQVVHDNEPQNLPTCPASGLPAGATNCVDRQASTYVAATGNIYMVVRTTDTSRYVCHKEDLTAPTILSATAGRWTKVRKPIRVTTRTDEPGTVAVAGVVRARGVKLRVGPSSATAAANQDTPVTVKLKRKQARKLKGVEKVKVVLTVTVTDLAGHATSRTVKVNLT